jgi:hypothetical protein
MGLNSEQRHRVIELLKQGQEVESIAREVGVGEMTVRAYKAHLTMGTYTEAAEAVLQDIEDVTEGVVFRLEKDMQAALRRNISQLEPGLQIVDDGAEVHVAAGFIDILAEDDKQQRVVIELKAGRAKSDALTQLLGYMGTVEPGPGGVRGIIVASDFDPRLLHAVNAIPNVLLRRYRYQFEFRDPADGFAAK